MINYIYLEFFGNDDIGQVFSGNDDIGVGKCIVEFEKQGTAVMEDVGTFLVKILRLGDTSSQVTIYWKCQNIDDIQHGNIYI